MSARQTTLGAALSARDVLGGQFVGDVDVDFYGGQQASSGGRTFPPLPPRPPGGNGGLADAELLGWPGWALVPGGHPGRSPAPRTPGLGTPENRRPSRPDTSG